MRRRRLTPGDAGARSTARSSAQISASPGPFSSARSSLQRPDRAGKRCSQVARQCKALGRKHACTDALLGGFTGDTVQPSRSVAAQAFPTARWQNKAIYALTRQSARRWAAADPSARRRLRRLRRLQHARIRRPPSPPPCWAAACLAGSPPRPRSQTAWRRPLASACACCGARRHGRTRATPRRMTQSRISAEGDHRKRSAKVLAISLAGAARVWVARKVQQARTAKSSGCACSESQRTLPPSRSGSSDTMLLIA